MEKLEVVNQKNLVIGQASRRQIHRLGLMHRSVHIFVFDAQGRLYLQRRSAQKDQYPGHWDSSAAGHVDPGESYETCARRELWEELGIKARLYWLARIPASAQTGWEHVDFYACRAETEPRPNLEEIDTGGFFAVAEIEAWLRDPGIKIAPGFRCLFVLWRHLASQIQGPEAAILNRVPEV
ncbi:MAG: NUDIX domain-containing protein [Deltaproteobacteria bacterium]|nr:NUDIX domain-containing protein [Deltaproteobacteria bacterium]